MTVILIQKTDQCCKRDFTYIVCLKYVTNITLFMFVLELYYVTKFYLGTESVVTRISSVTFLFSLCVIVLYLSVCVLCTGADFVIGLAPLTTGATTTSTTTTTTATSNNNRHNNSFQYYSNSNGNVKIPPYLFRGIFPIKTDSLSRMLHSCYPFIHSFVVNFCKHHHKALPLEYFFSPFHFTNLQSRCNTRLAAHLLMMLHVGAITCYVKCKQRSMKKKFIQIVQRECLIKLSACCV